MDPRSHPPSGNEEQREHIFSADGVCPLIPIQSPEKDTLLFCHEVVLLCQAAIVVGWNRIRQL